MALLWRYYGDPDLGLGQRGGPPANTHSCGFDLNFSALHNFESLLSLIDIHD